MTNEIHPFSIDINVADALDMKILSIGKCDIKVNHTNGKSYYLAEILTKNDSLCILQDTYVVYKNIQLTISRQVVLYDEVKALKFVEQTKLFKDGK